jgi:hypothetical protein
MGDTKGTVDLSISELWCVLCFGVLIPIWNAAKKAISKSMLLVLRSSNIARGLIGQKRMVVHVYTCDRAP